jgi:MYXO-CTERM domain-containing protein
MQGLDGDNVLFLKALTQVALPGDANTDATVAFADYQILEANFATGPGMTWSQGDFNGDGYVTFADYQQLEANFGHSAPEPAGLALLALGGLAMLRRRQR